MTLTLGEILYKVQNAKDRDERINILRYYDNKHLRMFFQFVFHPEAKWSFTKEELETLKYKPNPLRGVEGRVYAELKKFNYFIEGQYPNLTKQKKLLLLVEILENIDYNDAELLLFILKNGGMAFKTKYDGAINPFLIMDAYPDTLPYPAVTEPEMQADDNKTIVIDTVKKPVKPVKQTRTTKPK